MSVQTSVLFRAGKSLPWFGDGILGTATLSNTSLSGDAYYKNLTIPNGVLVTTNGFRIFVKNTLTLNGTIDNSANAINLGTCGAGAVGGQGQIANGDPGTAAPNSLGGASGFAYGDGLSTTGGAAGAVSFSATQGGPASVYNIVQAIMMSPMTISAKLQGGAGGAGGGGDNASVQGAGGGVGGGNILICARTITGTGTIQTNGQNGFDSVVGGGGGGGGGGGIVLIYENYSSLVILNNTGGIGGNGAFLPSGNGDSGSKILFKV